MESNEAVLNGNASKFVVQAGKKHDSKYDYSKVVYLGSKTKVEIICPVHGSFWQLPSNHVSGQTCPVCSIQSTYRTRDEFISQSLLIHGDKYDYSLVDKYRQRDLVLIICPTHGQFTQTIQGHLKKDGHGCHQCGMEASIRKQTDTRETFIEKSISEHNEVYNYSNVVYANTKTKVQIVCPKHGSFWQDPKSHVEGKGCPSCGFNRQISKAEISIGKFIEQCADTTVNFSYRLFGKTELDIYLPEHKLAIEYHGLYFHSSSGSGLKKLRDKGLHQSKMLACRAADVSLLQIFEDEWVNPVRQEIWKSIIRHKLGLTKTKIYARKCSLVELDFKTTSKFLEENHLMGKDSAPIRYGLAFGGTLLAVATFARPSLAGGNKKYDWNLSRFAVLKDTTVVGGFSRLLSHFLKHYPNVTLSTAADLRYSVGDVYTKNGFRLTHETRPNYWYWKGRPKRFHRFGFRKQMLEKKLEMYDPNITEKQNMVNNGWNIIHDAGNVMFELSTQCPTADKTLARGI